MQNLLKLMMVVLFTITPIGVLFNQTWQPVGSGFNATASDLFVDTINNKLLVGGMFTQAGGVLSPFITEYNDTNYSSIGVGFNASVRSIAQLDGEIYAIGSFTMSGTDTINSIAKWDNTANSWLPVLNSVNGYIYDIIEYQGDLYIGGTFTLINGVSTNKVAKFDGVSWTPSPLYTTAGSTSVGAFEKDNSGGMYYICNVVGGDRLYYYNGFSSNYISNPYDLYINTLKYLNGILYIGCDYDDSGFFNYIYSYDGSSISPTNYLPTNLSSTANLPGCGITLLAEKDNHLVVGVRYLTPSTPSYLFEAIGSSFVLIATSNDGSIFFDLEKYGYYYYTAGSFNNINGVNANRIARLYYPPPVANFNSVQNNTCIGSNVTFNNTTSNGPATYTWSFPGGIPSTSTSTNPTVLYNTIGSYDVMLVANSAYGTDTAIFTNYVQVNGLPLQPTITYTYPYLTSDYSSNNQWYLNGILISGATNQNYIPMSNGSYTVRYTDINGCFSISSPLIFNSLGINEESNGGKVEIYPNPITNYIYLDGIKETMQFNLLTVNGELINSKWVNETTGSILLDYLTPGVYLVQIRSMDIIRTFKLIKTE